MILGRVQITKILFEHYQLKRVH